MRRADRLFRIAQRLHHERVVTARTLAEELEVSERTIYRDIQDLSLSGVPVTGEAGVGYRLARGFRLPPLMFEAEELAALLLGMRMVQAWTDPALAGAAARAAARIEAALPERLLGEFAREELLVPDFFIPDTLREHLAPLRGAVRERRKLRVAYKREDGQASERILWPLGLFYWGRHWTLVAWCELRGAFRHFRLDRIGALDVLSEHFPVQAGRTLQEFLAQVRAEKSS